MKLSKFQHACFTIEQDGQVLVVDPGQITPDFVVPEELVAAIVVTHIHGDHLDLEKLHAIQAKYPDTHLYAHPEVIAEFDSTATNTHTVNAGDSINVGPFHLEFIGGEHALIHPDIPMCANLGVIINNRVYYPGDSFIKPGKPIDVLALPIAAPWMKTAEGMDFLVSIAPKMAFPTHDAVLSDAGKQFTDNWMQRAAEKAGCTYQRIDNATFVVE